MSRILHLATAVYFASLALIPPPAIAEQSLNSSCRVTGRETNLETKLKARVGFETRSTATGDTAKLEWDIRSIAEGDVRNDAFLIIGLPEAVRLKGEGFIAVPPQARATRSIQSLDGQTRLIVPLTGPLANLKGEATLLFYTSGELQVPWEIVQLRSTSSLSPCTEVVQARGSFEIAVELGPPELVTQNRFAQGRPKAVYESADARFLLLEFSGRYQVLSKESGELIVDQNGTSPRFSPRGRYVTSFEGDRRLHVLDILARKVVFSTTDIEQGYLGGVAVATWMNNDAVLVLGYGRQGAVTVAIPLIDDRNVSSGSIGCNACQGFGSTSIEVDLDQLTFVADSSGAAYESSLVEVADSLEVIAEWEKSAPDNRGPEPKRPKFPISTFNSIAHVDDRLTIPEDKKNYQDEMSWLFSDKISVSVYEVWNGDVGLQRKLLAAKASRPKIHRESVDVIVANTSRTLSRATTLSGIRVSPKSEIEKLSELLLRFGVTIAEPGKVDRSVPRARTKDDFDGRTKAAAKMLQPVAARASQGRARIALRKEGTRRAGSPPHFAEEYRTFPGCSPDEDDLEDDREEPPIVSANRLDALWQFEVPTGTMFVFQQSDYCGTAPDLYGDLISLHVPRDAKQPVSFRRLAASASDAGAVFDPIGIDSKRAALGAALRLTRTPELLLSKIDNRFLIVVSKDTGAAAVFRVPTMDLVQSFDSLESPLDIESVTMSADHRTLMQANASGALRFFDLSSKRMLLAGRYIDDELVLFDQALNFESTAEGAAYLFVRVPGIDGFYSLDQFTSRLRDPGVASKRIKGEPPIARPRNGLTPPTLKVERKANSYSVTAQSGSDLRELRILVDGKIVQRRALTGRLTTESVQQTNAFEGRWLNFVAEDKEGLVSRVQSFLIDRKRYPGTLRVLTLGVDKFNAGRLNGRPVIDLGHAASDATRFQGAAKNFLAPSYRAFETRKLEGTNANRPKLLSEIRELAGQTTDQDTLILFFASHGVADANGFSLVLPSPTTRGEVVKVPFADISNELRAAKGRVMVFLDACHSAGATQDEAAEQLVGSNPNITVITASKGQQLSLESAAWGGGIFTTALIGTFRDSHSALASARDPITLEQIYAAVRQSVSTQTKGRQTPWLRRSSWVGSQSIN